LGIIFRRLILGISLVIGSACVFNNVMDKDIDQLMERTRHRAMVSGSVSKRNAVIFGTILLALGLLVLRQHTNMRTLLVGLVGFLVYIFLYTPLKRRTHLGTLIGSISGATPLVAGYVAVTNRFDTAALLLFLILVTWQMPHFYAIAIRRLDDYRLAGIPVLPVKKGILITKINIVSYIVVFIVATSLLYFYGYTGKVYLVVVGLIGLAWLWQGMKGFKKNIDDKMWAKKTFLFSLVVLLVFSITLAISSII
jgi:protoheme IX farnesyltransferase